jgi:glycosyltransferase involved in cell wall biosynthesis
VRLTHSGLPAVARNAGIGQSKGKFIAFLDSDDLWLPEKIEKQLQAAARNPSAGLFYSRAESFDDFGHKVPSVSYQGKREGQVFRSLLFFNFVPILTVMVPRVVLEKEGVFDERPDFRAIEDYDLILRIAAHHPVHYTSEVLARHRVHSANIWSYDMAMIDRWEKVLSKNFQGLFVSSFTRRQALAQLDLHRFKMSLQQAGTKEATRGYLTKALRQNPLLVSAYAYLALLYMGGFSLLRILSRFKIRPRGKMGGPK